MNNLSRGGGGGHIFQLGEVNVTDSHDWVLYSPEEANIKVADQSEDPGNR